MIIIPSCRVHGSHLVKFLRGQLLKNIPAVLNEKHEPTKDRTHLCLYFTDNEKPTLCIASLSPTLLFHGNCSIPPPAPSQTLTTQHCSVPSPLACPSFHTPFRSHKFCTRHLCVGDDALLTSLSHSLTNPFRNRKLQCALGAQFARFSYSLPF